MRLYESPTNHGYLEKVPGKREKQFWSVSADDAKGDSTNSGSQLCSAAHIVVECLKTAVTAESLDISLGRLKVLFVLNILNYI